MYRDIVKQELHMVTHIEGLTFSDIETMSPYERDLLVTYYKELQEKKIEARQQMA